MEEAIRHKHEIYPSSSGNGSEREGTSNRGGQKRETDEIQVLTDTISEIAGCRNEYRVMGEMERGHGA